MANASVVASGTALGFPVEPVDPVGGNIAVTTNADGVSYTAFVTQACDQLSVINGTGVALDIRQGGIAPSLILPIGGSYTFYGISDAAQLSVRRNDVAVTPVTLVGRWLG